MQARLRRCTQSNGMLLVPTAGKDGPELAVVSPGGCFGEMALLTSEARAASVMATSDAVVRLPPREAVTSTTQAGRQL